MTSSQSSSDSWSKMSRQRLSGFFITATVKQTSGEHRLLLYMLQHVMPSNDLHGSGCMALFAASSVPILSVPFKPALILILAALRDNTALHKMFIPGRNLILYWFSASHFSKKLIRNLPTKCNNYTCFKIQWQKKSWKQMLAHRFLW